jgi:hypothetical protein
MDLGYTVVSFALIALVGVVTASVFIWIGAKISRVPGASFGRSMVAAVAAGFLNWLGATVLLELEVTSEIAGFLIGLFLTLLVIKSAFDTTWGKSLLVWVFNVIAQVAAFAVGSYLFAGDMPTPSWLPV